MINTKKRDIQGFRIMEIAIVASFPLRLISEILSHSNRGFTTFDLKAWNMFTGFCLFIPVLIIIFNKMDNLTTEKEAKIKSKVKILYFINILLLSYPIVGYIVTKNIDIIFSFLIMEGHFIGIIYTTKLLTYLTLDDYQLKWYKATQGFCKEETSNIFWRFKIWVYPHESVKFTDRLPNFLNIIIALVCLDRFIYSQTYLYKLISAILFILIIASWIEAILGLQTSIKGVCTGSVYKDKMNNRGGYHEYFITDYKHKREIHICSQNDLYINEGEEATVVHGIFTKYPIYLNRVKVKKGGLF